nr:putative retrotransposon Ty1-copia subclass protein [Tanacetum cinerariifolium]
MVFDAELSINTIISGLPVDYNQFMLSYQMNGKETSIIDSIACCKSLSKESRKLMCPLLQQICWSQCKEKKYFSFQFKEKAAKGKSNRGSKGKAEYEIAPTSDPKEAGLNESRRLHHGELNLDMRKKKIMPDRGSKIELEEIQASTDEEPIVNTDTQPEVVTPVKHNDISLHIRKTSGRVSKPPQFYYGFHIEKDKISDSTLSELDEYANYKEAMASPEPAKWKEAMKNDIQSTYENRVWNLVDTTPGLKMVGCKWIFKKKIDMDGKVHTYKARLVANGYTQTHEIDYEGTFSPVAKIKSIRIMLDIAAFHDYEIWQMDVKTAFLKGKMTKDGTTRRF